MGPISRVANLAAIVELGDHLVDFGDLRVARIGNHLAAREDGEQQHLGRRRFGADRLDDGGDAVGDLLGGVAAGVIGADHEDGDLGLDAVEFAVLDAPEDVLGAVAADAEVGGLHEADEGFIPDRLGIFAASRR